MNSAFRESFQRDLKKIKDRTVLHEVRAVIENVDNVDSVLDIPSFKKLRGYTDYYRIRLRNYRIGVRIADDTVTFIRILHRRDIYRYFP
jgi:mRNA interferase RelE/StbE